MQKRAASAADLSDGKLHFFANTMQINGLRIRPNRINTAIWPSQLSNLYPTRMARQDEKNCALTYAEQLDLATLNDSMTLVPVNVG